MIRTILAGALLACSMVASAAEPVPLDHFIKRAQFIDVAISPTGEYLAASVLATEDTGALVVLSTKDQKLLGHFRMSGRTFIDSFTWVNPTRILLSVAEGAGSKANPTNTFEIYGMDFDGRNQTQLISPRSGKGKIRAGVLVDDLQDDDKFVLVWTRGVGHSEGDYPLLERMNVNTGARSLVARAPILNASFRTDHHGRARFAWGVATNGRQKLYYRPADGGEWTLINDENESGQSLLPLGFSRDEATVLMRVTQKKGPDTIETWDVATREREELASDETVDPLGVAWSFDRRHPWGVAFMDGKPRMEYLDEAAEEAKLHAMLSKAFPGRWISDYSYTRDGRKIVFRTSSDRDPGQYYLFDRDANKATFLLALRPWIEPERLAEMKPIQYRARDGLTIHGYLTLPPGSDGKNLPLVLNPHGGPIGPFDAWAFNQEVQLLASRGYAVLQVNYRGSGNYGADFGRAGWRQWGDGMIDDMTDGVKWAIAQGIADADRVCIYGASYGGYAAMQAPIREPDLYQCAIGYVGVYDMNAMYTYGDIPDTEFGKYFLAEKLGADRKFLDRISPSKNVDKIDLPVFIIVGNDDIRAHPKHSRLMRDALRKSGKEVEWLEKNYEGHGFYKEENNRELYTKMLAFLEKHIGKGETGASGAP